MTLGLAEIARLFAERGGVAYAGEPVSQLEHALQCAWLAEQAGAGDALVTAALLHELGPPADRRAPDARAIATEHRWAGDAVRLRLWDEEAKVEGLKTPPLAHFLATAARVLLR
jgi:predicted HD phosphohydrolase